MFIVKHLHFYSLLHIGHVGTLLLKTGNQRTNISNRAVTWVNKSSKYKKATSKCFRSFRYDFYVSCVQLTYKAAQ